MGAAESTVEMENDSPPQAVTAPINLPGLTQSYNAIDCCGVSVVGEYTRIESQLWGVTSLMFYSGEVKKTASSL